MDTPSRSELIFNRSDLALKALRELGPIQLGLYGLYRLGIRTGYFNRKLTLALKRLNKLDRRIQPRLQPCLPNLPDSKDLLALIGPQTTPLLKEADEIVRGYVRLFGHQLAPLELTPPKPLNPWMMYEDGSNLVNEQDIKYIWEPARFGWACKLALAYHLSKSERYTEAFWHYTEQFLTSNPPYQGPHWSSAQEVAIRLIALAFASQVFAESKQSTPQRVRSLAQSIAIHAERIPPTLLYARSQNNNHLITEALGLYTASAMLSEHPLAPQWHELGWKWLSAAFQTQISPDGTYTQHSTNYHRLMLQSALWAFAVHEYSFHDDPISASVSNRLEAATRWLWIMIDPESGHVPNLGHNDGSYILPLTVCPYEDYRPVLYAAARTFLHTQIFPSGPWDDMSAWFGLPTQTGNEAEVNIWRLPNPHVKPDLKPPYIMTNRISNSWIMLRAAEFRSRPAHADQLHLDLWWRGLNLALDPGTYLYNSPPPWENQLASVQVHNTISVDGQDMMLRVSRFLYLDWAQATITNNKPSKEGGWEILSAQHNGYRKLGINHSRMVTTFSDGHWEILDLLDGPSDAVHTARLHWLLPNWECELFDLSNEANMPSYGIHLKSPGGWVWLKISAPSDKWKDHPTDFNFQVARAGEVLLGSSPVPPITGWTSPTYGDKIPALACIVEVTQALPIDIKSEWTFPDGN